MLHRNDKAVEFNKLKRKLDDLTVEYRMLIGYINLVEEAVVQEFRQYVNPRSVKRHRGPSPPRSLPYRTRQSYFYSPLPLSPPASSPSSQSSSLASSPLQTPMHERLLPSLISYHTTSPV